MHSCFTLLLLNHHNTVVQSLRKQLQKLAAASRSWLKSYKLEQTFIVKYWRKSCYSRGKEAENFLGIFSGANEIYPCALSNTI